ncbi:MAG: VWA domain-containing protein [Brumimicrobium sp.]
MSNFLANIKFWEYNFASPHWFWLMLLIPVLLFFRYRAMQKKSGIFKFSRPAADLKAIEFSPIKWVIFMSYLLITFGSVLLIFALALPSLPFSNDNKEEYGEGIDIILSMDISGSMMATDFLPNRLEAAKDVAKEFIDGRNGDRIGLVVYEGEAYTACPATRNYDYLKKSIDNVEPGYLEPGTAIGTGLGTAVARLRSDSLQSKVIILLTDGESNKGEVSPVEAAELAKNKNITVYTIGVGKEGYASMPVNTVFGTVVKNTRVSIDEKVLKEIAKITNGAYFRATDKSSLREIYKEIEEMEKTKIVDETIKREPPYEPESFLTIGLICLLFGLGIEQFLYKSNA